VFVIVFQCFIRLPLSLRFIPITSGADTIDLAEGDTVNKCPSPLKVLKENTSIAVIGHVQMNIGT
jgi:hypothetical protein